MRVGSTECFARASRTVEARACTRWSMFVAAAGVRSCQPVCLTRGSHCGASAASMRAMAGGGAAAEGGVPGAAVPGAANGEFAGDGVPDVAGGVCGRAAEALMAQARANFLNQLLDLIGFLEGAEGEHKTVVLFQV